MKVLTAKRKNGNGFYRITEAGKTIKKYDYKTLAIKVKYAIKKKKLKLTGNPFRWHKSLLWKICIDNDLL